MLSPAQLKLWDLKDADTSAFVDLFNLSQFYLQNFESNFTSNIALHSLSYFLLFQSLEGRDERKPSNELLSSLYFFKGSTPHCICKGVQVQLVWIEWSSVSPLAFYCPNATYFADYFFVAPIILFLHQPVQTMSFISMLNHSKLSSTLHDWSFGRTDSLKILSAEELAFLSIPHLWEPIWSHLKPLVLHLEDERRVGKWYHFICIFLKTYSLKKKRHIQFLTALHMFLLH